MNSPTEHKGFPKWEKKDRKDKGYHVFEADSTPEKEEVASPKTKSRTKPSFKISKKEKTPSKSEKEKEAKKEKKERKKLSRKKQPQQNPPSQPQQSPYPQASEQPLRPVIGVPLELAVRRSKSHDGVALPAFFRECIDYVEAQGLSVEGIYRISPVKSKVQGLVMAINMGRRVELADFDPCVIAGLIKLFLRELPEPVLTLPLGANFEEASALRDPQAKLRAFKQLLELLPRTNFLLLAWMVLHATHVISRSAENKMTHQNVSIVLSPTMQISHRVLNVFLTYPNDLFSGVQFRRYSPPLQPSAAGGGRVELPDSAAAVEEELAKQESLLATLHEEIKEGDTNPEKEAQIWEVQRFCTQLKRKRHLLVSLVSREAIEGELSKQEGVLARLHGQLEKAGVGTGVAQETHDELWEVQRTVTMLKRKLKAAQRPRAPSGDAPGPDLRSSRAVGLGSEEDVMLNLTLRKVDKGPTEPVLPQPPPSTKAAIKEAPVDVPVGTPAQSQFPREVAVDVPKEAVGDSKTVVSSPKELEVRKESPKNVPKETTVEFPKETPVEFPKETPVEFPKETPVEFPRETPVKFPKETPVEFPRETPVEFPKEIPVEFPKETPVEFPKETPVEFPKETPVEFPKETPVEFPKEMSVEFPKETPVEFPRETPVEFPKETPVEFPKEIPLEFPKETPVEFPKETPVEFPKEMPVEFPTETPVEFPKETPVEFPKEEALAYEAAPQETDIKPDAISRRVLVPMAGDVGPVAARTEESGPEDATPVRRPPVSPSAARVSESSRSSSSVVAHSSIMDEEEEAEEEGHHRSSGEPDGRHSGTEDLAPVIRSSESHRRSHLLSFGPMISLDDFIERGCLAAGESDLLLGDEDEDEELRSAFDDYRRLRYEEEELCAIGNDLTTRIQSERHEIARLQKEISRLKGNEAADGGAGLTSITECDFSGGDLSSEEEDSSEEEGEEELAKQYQQLLQDNERLGRENQALVENIQRERMLCAEIKVQMRMMIS